MPTASGGRGPRAHHEVRRARLHNQLLVDSRAVDAHEVVTRLGALQAQDYGSMLWAIGVRTQGATLQDVTRALAEARIVRSWPLRVTLQVVAAEDLRWMLRLTAPRALAKSRRRRDALGLTPDVLKRSERALARALSGGDHATRAELAAALVGAGIAVDHQRTYHLLFYFSLQGLICFGPHRGKEPTFVLLDAWVPPARAWTEDEALGTLAGRYLATRWPARAADFAWWSGLTLGRAREGLALAGDPPQGTEPRGTSAQLLPGFDEYLLSYAERAEVLADEHAQAVVPGKNGIFLPTIVVEGQVVGTWKRSVGKRSVRIALSPFASLSARARRGIAQAASRYGAFLQLPVELG